MSFPGELQSGDAVLDFRAAYDEPGGGGDRDATYRVFRVNEIVNGWPEVGAQVPDLLNGTLSLPVNPPSPFNREEVGYGWPDLGGLVLPDADVPSSGLYCLMVSDDVGGADPAHTRYAYFLARRRTAQTKVLVVYPFATLAAYAGGAQDAHVNVYNSFEPRRARQVSLDRPFDSWAFDVSKEPVCIDFPRRLHEFLTTQVAPPPPGTPETGGPGLTDAEVDVCTSFDLHGDPSILDGIELVILVGHDEYWSKAMRDKLEAFVAAGGRVMFLSANTAWWQVRLDLTERIMRCAKSSLEDPYALAQYEEVTTNFCAVPAAGIAGGGFANREENTLTGVSYRRGVQGPVAASGYVVASADPAYFAGTGLTVGQTFGGSTLFSLETDAADFTLQGGVPVLTGRDGSPTNFQILAHADLTDSQAPQRGKATMGVFTNVGTVFNAASTHWVDLIDTDPIRTITRNAVRTLLAATPASAMSLPAREYPGDAFSQIGGALSGVTPAIAGIVQGQLLLLRDGANRVMDPENPSVGEEAPPAISTLANATCYGSDLFGGYVHAGTSAGTVHYHTARIFAAGQGWTAWTANAGEPIVGIASNDGKPYLVTRPASGAPSTLRLMNAGGASLTTLGRVYPPLRAVTSLDGVLYALHDTGTDVTSAVRVYARLASASDAVWTHVFDAPPGSYAIGAYYGRIYVLAGGVGTSAPTLHWRAAVPDAATPYAPTRLLFVNGQSYAIGALTYDGTYTGVKSDTLPILPAKVCRANDQRVFVYGAVRNGSLVTFDAAGDVTEVKSWGAWSFGAWDLIVPLRCTYNKDWKDPAQLAVTEKVLFYRASTGASSIGSFAADGTYVQDSAPAFSAGWTQITCTHEGEILFYNAASGLYAIGQIDDAGQWHTTGSSGTIGTGWEQVVATGNTWVVFYKNGPNFGTVELRELHNGVLSASLLSAQPPNNQLEKDRTLFPALNGTQLAYDATTGMTTSLGWREGANVTEARVVLRDYPAGFSLAWAHIVGLGAP